jgi:hypothetical protein
MPWVSSPKHELPPKNQNVVKLWKTVIRNLGSHVGFTVNDRSPMSPITLSAMMSSYKDRGVPVDVSFRGGQRRQMMIRAVGDTWFSAQETGITASELVVTFAAVSLMSADFPDLEQETVKRPRVPLTAMLVQLERQHTRVAVHLSGLTMVGHLNGVGLDCVGLTQKDGTPVVIPLGDFLWLEACG